MPHFLHIALARLCQKFGVAVDGRYWYMGCPGPTASSHPMSVSRRSKMPSPNSPV